MLSRPFHLIKLKRDESDPVLYGMFSKTRKRVHEQFGGEATQPK